LWIEGVAWSAQRNPKAIFSISRPDSLLFIPNSSSAICMAEWTPFQTHYFSENLVVPGIEPGTSGSVAKN
jgi:hypothetical protein